MNLTLWKPFQDIERFFNDDFELPRDHNAIFSPKVHVEETDKHLVIQAELPGLDEKDIKVSIDKNVLTISGERKTEKKEENDGYHYSEIQFGKFERSFRIPEYVKSDSAKAGYKHGVLSIKLEKRPEASPKQIEVKAGY